MLPGLNIDASMTMPRFRDKPEDPAAPDASFQGLLALLAGNLPPQIPPPREATPPERALQAPTTAETSPLTPALNPGSSVPEEIPPAPGIRTANSIQAPTPLEPRTAPVPPLLAEAPLPGAGTTPEDGQSLRTESPTASMTAVPFADPTARPESLPASGLPKTNPADPKATFAFQPLHPEVNSADPSRFSLLPTSPAWVPPTEVQIPADPSIQIASARAAIQAPRLTPFRGELPQPTGSGDPAEPTTPPAAVPPETETLSIPARPEILPAAELPMASPVLQSLPQELNPKASMRGSSLPAFAAQSAIQLVPSREELPQLMESMNRVEFTALTGAVTPKAETLPGLEPPSGSEAQPQPLPPPNPSGSAIAPPEIAIPLPGSRKASPAPSTAKIPEEPEAIPVPDSPRLASVEKKHRTLNLFETLQETEAPPIKSTPAPTPQESSSTFAVETKVDPSPTEEATIPGEAPQTPRSGNLSSGHALAVSPSSVRPQANGAASVSTAPIQASPMPQIEGSIRWMVRHQEQEAELQLHPENLGRISISIKVEGTEVHARVWASEASTLDVLQSHRSFLQQSLQQQGLNLGSFDLQSGYRGEDARSGADTRPSIPSRAPIPAIESVQEVPTAPTIISANPHRIELFA